MGDFENLSSTLFESVGRGVLVRDSQAIWREDSYGLELFQHKPRAIEHKMDACRSPEPGLLL
jgi:hypothetical protein